MSFGFKNLDWSVITSGDFRNFKLLKPEYYVARDGTIYCLPFAAPSDLASIPSVLWSAPLFLTPFGWYAPACYGHDCAFQNTLQIVSDEGIRLANLSEAQSNDLLLEMMQSIKPNPTCLEQAQMKAIYEGVCLGGWHAYKADRS